MMNYRLNKKLLRFLSVLSDNSYYKNLISNKDLCETNIWDFYFKIAPIKRQDILDNLIEYISNDFKANMSDIKVEELLKNIIDLSNNHDKQINIDNKIWNIEFTTGTTGRPFPIIKSPKTRMIESMHLLKKRKTIYSNTQINNGFLFLHPTRKDILSINLWDFDEDDMKYIIDDWNRMLPKWIFGTPLILYKFAEKVKEIKPDLFCNKKIEFIEYTSQHLNNEQRHLISEVYNCQIISNYGSREFWNIAYQCVNGNMHINDDYLIIDIIDEQGNIIDEYNKIGDVVITNLINDDMPLLKYYLGDRAKLIKSNCECGCDSDIIELVSERENEKLKNTSYYGSKIFRRVMRGIYFHDYFEDIKKIKIIQDGDFHLTVYLDKTLKEDKKFEARFINRTCSIVPEFINFKVSFIYEFPFANEDYRFKEILFKSII